MTPTPTPAPTPALPTPPAPTPAPPVLSASGMVTSTGYQGYVTISISAVGPSLYINYTHNGVMPTCDLAATPPSASFVLTSTAEVCLHLVFVCVSRVLVCERLCVLTSAAEVCLHLVFERVCMHVTFSCVCKFVCAYVNCRDLCPCDILACLCAYLVCLCVNVCVCSRQLQTCV
jgi:hypothetical protein